MTRSEPTARGEQTKQLIVNAAIDLFRDNGYEKTTMRAIARRAEVSVGNAYYYFPSKDHLVQEFYAGIQGEHAVAAEAVLRDSRDLPSRACGVLHTLIDVMTPYHGFAGKFIKNALEPGSPLSPFSEESAPARERSLTLWRRVVDDSSSTMDSDLREELPELLWLAQMGVTLYWVHDTSPEQARTRTLIDSLGPFIERAVTASRVPVLRGFARDAVGLMRELRE